MWACGAAGSALPWHGRGHRFDPDQVHQQIIQYQLYRRYQAPPPTASRVLKGAEAISEHPATSFRQLSHSLLGFCWRPQGVNVERRSSVRWTQQFLSHFHVHSHRPQIRRQRMTEVVPTNRPSHNPCPFRAQAEYSPLK